MILLDFLDFISDIGSDTMHNIYMLAENPKNLIDVSNFEKGLVSLRTQLNKFSGNLIVDAKSLGVILILVVFALKSYGMMTGDEKLDIMPLLRPFGLFACIVLWGTLTTILESPFKGMEGKVKGSFYVAVNKVNEKHLQRTKAVQDAIKRYYEKDAKISAKSETLIGQLYDSAVEAGKDLLNIDKILSQKIMLEASRIYMKLVSLMERVIIIIFQFLFLIVFYLRILIINLLRVIGPLSFAFSIIPAFKDSYIKWISKFISVSLYGVFAYLAAIMGLAHILANQEKSISYWSTYNVASKDAQLLGDMISQMPGELTYMASLLVGATGILVAPFVAHWVIGSGSTGSLVSKGVGTGKKLINTFK